MPPPPCLPKATIHYDAPSESSKNFAGAEKIRPGLSRSRLLLAADMVFHPLDDHIQCNQIFAALGHDDVRTALARLHKLLVHRLDGRKILLHHALQRAAALLHVPHHAAQNTHVRVGIHKYLHIHQIPQLGIRKNENALKDDDACGRNEQRVLGTVVHRKVVDRAVDFLPGAQRRQVLDGEDLRKNIQSMMRFYVDTYVASAFGEQPKLADKQHFFEMMTHFEPIFFPTGTWLLSDEELAALTREQAEEKILSLMQRAYAKREEQFTSPVMREIERVVTLRVVDEFWMDHIDAMDDLRQGIRLRAYAQTDPVIEYKREGFDMFEAMNDAIKEEIVRRVFLVRIKTNEEIKRQRVAKVTGEGAGGDKTVKRQPVVKKIKVGPNDPCPCGSGKKYKKCCRDKDLAAERGQNAN